MRGIARDIEMPYVELEVEQPWGEQTGEEQPKREQDTREHKVQTVLVSGGVVEVAPLQIDDNPLLTVWSHADVPPHGDDRVRYGAGHSYSRKRVSRGPRRGQWIMWAAVRISD